MKKEVSAMYVYYYTKCTLILLGCLVCNTGVLYTLANWPFATVALLVPGLSSQFFPIQSAFNISSGRLYL